MDASLVNGLAGDAGMGIDVIMALQEREETVIIVIGDDSVLVSGKDLENQSLLLGKTF